MSRNRKRPKSHTRLRLLSTRSFHNFNLDTCRKHIGRIWRWGKREFHNRTHNSWGENWCRNLVPSQLILTNAPSIMPETYLCSLVVCTGLSWLSLYWSTDYRYSVLLIAIMYRLCIDKAIVDTKLIGTFCLPFSQPPVDNFMFAILHLIVCPNYLQLLMPPDESPNKRVSWNSKKINLRLNICVQDYRVSSTLEWNVKQTEWFISIILVGIKQFINNNFFTCCQNNIITALASYHSK